MKKTEICLHCHDDYIPTRRGVQKFCSKSCKSRYWYLKQNKNSNEIKTKIENAIVEQESLPEKMSWAGVGNAAAGTGVIEAAKRLLTSAENQPATKKDIQEIKEFIKGRYLRVNNSAKDAFGRSPYYDVETGNVVFL